MNILITDIKWDTDGEPVEECALPTTVVVLDAPGDTDSEDMEETLSETLSEAYGFCHDGFRWERLNPAHDTHAGGGFFPQRLGLARWVG